MNVGVNQGEIDSEYKSVNEQTGIFAGSGGFDIDVGGNADLKGAVIDSEATPDQNKLSTGTLTWSDIENKAEYSASSAGMGYGIGNANFTDNGLQPKLGVPVSDSDTSTTQSAIAQGTIEIRSDADKPADQRTDLSKLSRDTENANQSLANNFDKDAVKERLEVNEMIFDGVVDLVKTEVEKQRIADEEAAAKKKAEEEAAAKKKAEEEAAAEKKRMEEEKIAAEKKAEAERLAAEEAKKTVSSSGLIKPIAAGTEAGYSSDSGLDIGASIGTPVLAAADGKVVYAEYGHTVWLRKDPNTGELLDSLYSVLIELDKPIVSQDGRTAPLLYYTHLSALAIQKQDGSAQVIQVRQEM